MSAALLTVHDPRGYPPKVTAKRLAPRLEALDGKLIHLVDCLFDNSEVFMQQLQGWFAEHMPGVRTEIVKPRESWVDDPAMRAKVVKEADAAIFAVGL
jgi:ATP-dependent phosphoenolpyruvate carboxykinase